MSFCSTCCHRHTSFEERKRTLKNTDYRGFLHNKANKESIFADFYLNLQLKLIRNVE